jgi:hypothetical protein
MSPRHLVSDARFPATQISLVQRVASADPEVRQRALETVARVYWAPIYTHVRLRHGASPEDAEDLTQGFFGEALRRELFARFDPARARFRTYVRTCVDAYVANERKGERRLKRGGGTVTVSLDVAGVEERLATGADAETVFEREWVRAVFATAVERLRTRCRDSGKLVHLTLFERYDIAEAAGDATPTYAALAAELGITTTQATNWLAAVRRDFRGLVLDTLRELCGSDDELRAEARSLLGIEV